MKTEKSNLETLPEDPWPRGTLEYYPGALIDGVRQLASEMLLAHHLAFKSRSRSPDLVKQCQESTREIVAEMLATETLWKRGDN